MANTIRTPRPGTSATSRRIAQAVDDEDWQKFRVSMKGQTTKKKIRMLRDYFWSIVRHSEGENCDDCNNVRIRVDNYIKALCRGGQLYPGESLKSVAASGWNPKIKK